MVGFMDQMELKPAQPKLKLAWGWDWTHLRIPTMHLLRSSVHTAGDNYVLPGRWPQLSPLGCCCQAPGVSDNKYYVDTLCNVRYLQNVVTKDNLRIGSELYASRFDQAAKV